ncbi:hypothetical protein HEP87_61550 [Streptomyces sp. S1D4-11]
MVFVFHASLPLPLVRLIADDKVEQRFGWAVGPSGAFGVTFFFVLSGFVLTWSAPGNDTAPSFWRLSASSRSCPTMSSPGSSRWCCTRLRRPSCPRSAPCSCSRCGRRTSPSTSR